MVSPGNDKNVVSKESTARYSISNDQQTAELFVYKVLLVEKPPTQKRNISKFKDRQNNI